MNDTMKQCGACGVSMGAAAKFCPECGTAQSVTPANAARLDVAAPETLADGKKKGRTGRIVMVIVGLALAAGAVVAGLQFLPSMGRQPKLYHFCEAKDACGYLDAKGKVAIPARFDEAYSFADNGLATVKLDGKYGYIDESGELVIPARFDDAARFADNGLASITLDGKYGYIDESGELVIPARFDGSRNFADNGLAAVKLDGKYGYIDESGELVIPARFVSVSRFADNGLAAVKLDGKYSYINASGEIAIPARFDDAASFADNGLAWIALDGKYGYIDESGELVIPARFDDAGNFADNGLAAGKLDGKYGYINASGEMVIPARFDDAGNFADNGLAAVKLDGKWGAVDESGITVVPIIFDGLDGYYYYFAASFGEKRYPILPDGTFLGFTRSDVDAEYARIESERRLEEERRRLSACNHIYVGKVYWIRGTMRFLGRELPDDRKYSVLSVSPQHQRVIVWDDRHQRRSDVSCSEVP